MRTGQTITSAAPATVDSVETETEILNEIKNEILNAERRRVNNQQLVEGEIDLLRLEPFVEVKNLMWIKRNSVYSAALEEWDRKEKLLTDRVDKKEKRSGDLKNEIYQLVGFFSVFQGVVLTAVTQLTQSQDGKVCNKVWSPVILTALAWMVATIGVFQKLSRIEILEYEREDEDQARRMAVRRALALRRKGEEFKFSEIEVVDNSGRIQPKSIRGYKLKHFWVNRFGAVFASMSVFTGIFIASYFLMLCNRGLGHIG